MGRSPLTTLFENIVIYIYISINLHITRHICTTHIQVDMHCIVVLWACVVVQVVYYGVGAGLVGFAL